jgi:hypothetical protein
MFQILVMQYRRHFIHLVFPSIFLHVWKFKIRMLLAPVYFRHQYALWVRKLIRESQPILWAMSYEIRPIIICTSWNRKITMPQAAATDLRSRRGSVACSWW